MNVVEENKYLGLIINKNNDGNEATLLKFKTVERCFFSLNGFGMKPPGVSPKIKAFIYNTYCLPKCTYGMGIFNLNKKTIKSINVAQNNLFRYALNIPYKTHITLIMKSLKILDATTLYYSQICILIKLLHRHEFTKKLLMGCLDDSVLIKIDIFDDIKIISNLLSIDIKKVIEYPDKTRDLLIEKYLNNPDETESIDKIKSLLDNYTIENKKELIEITRLNYIVNMNSQAIT